MRLRSITRFVVLAAVLGIVGCSSNNKGKIEGTRWTSQATTVNEKAIPAGFHTLDFAKDGKLTYTNKSAGTYTGRYSLGLGDLVTFHLDQELNGSKRHLERIVITGNTLKMIDGGGNSVTFDKAP